MHTTAHCGTTTYAGETDPRFGVISDASAPHGVAWRATYVPSSTTGCFCYPNVCREEAGQGNPSTTFPNGVDRTWHQGQDVWISSEVKLDANWPTSNYGTMVYQLTHPQANGGPPAALAVLGGQWDISSLTSNAYNSTAGVQHSIGSIVPGLGKYVKFSIHMKMNSDPSQGAITVYSDLANPGGPMTQVYSKDPTFTLNTGPSGQANWPGFMTFGFYTNAAKDPQPMGMESAGLTVATTRAAAEANAFTGGGTTGGGTSTAAFTATPSPSTIGTAVTFDASTSTCASAPCTYTWTDANGNRPLGTGTPLSFTFHHHGTKRVTLALRDATGAVSTIEHDLVVQ